MFPGASLAASAAERLSGVQVVANRHRRDPSLAHGVADLIETAQNIARRVEAVDRGALMGVNLQAAFRGHRRAQPGRKV